MFTPAEHIAELEKRIKLYERSIKEMLESQCAAEEAVRAIQRCHEIASREIEYWKAKRDHPLRQIDLPRKESPVT